MHLYSIRYTISSALIALFVTQAAYSDIGLMVHESNHGYLSGPHTGHMAVFMDRLCRDAGKAHKLHLCGAGDAVRGVVINRIPRISPEKYNWLAIPLVPYLYGVQSEKQIPLLSNEKIDALLSRRSFFEYLAGSIAVDSAGEPPFKNGKAEWNWQSHFNESYHRDIWMMSARTTEEQDVRVMEWLNNYDHQNNPFNFYFQNCSDLSREILNIVFQEAGSGKNLRSDLDLFSSPKGMAQRLQLYSAAHPETQFQITYFPQTSSSFPRSTFSGFPLQDLYSGLQVFSIPLLIVKPAVAAGFGLYYEVFNRYVPHSEYKKYFSQKIAGKFNLGLSLSSEQDRIRNELTTSPVNRRRGLTLGLIDVNERIKKNNEEISALQEEEFGRNSQWKDYRVRFRKIISTLISIGEIDRADFERGLMKLIEEKFNFTIDSSGYLEISEMVSSERTGLTRDTVLRGNPRLARLVLAASVQFYLGSRNQHRMPIRDFETLWSLLERSLSN